MILRTIRRAARSAPASLVAALLTLVAMPARGVPTPVAGVERDADGVRLHVQPGTLRIQVWGDRALRVTYAAADHVSGDNGLAVVGAPAGVPWQLEQTPDAVVVRTAAVQARVDRKTGAVTFADAAGTPFLRERVGGRDLPTATIAGQRVTGAAQAFELAAGEGIFGLGQHPDGGMDYVGHAVHLQQRNTDVAVPVLMSSKGYGVFWNDPAVTDVDVGQGDPTAVRWSSEAGDGIDYFVFYGPTLDGAVGGYRAVTGAAPMFGRWAWGYWQSRERYRTQDELLAVAREYRRRQIPIDGMVQDWDYWLPQAWGSHAFGPNFPHPGAMSNELHDLGFHWIISVWAKFDKGSANHDALDKAGFLFPDVFPSVFPQGWDRWYDAFSPGARAMYWRQISDELFRVGVDGWWLDATEPELGGNWGEMRGVRTAAGPGYKVYNAYPLETTTGVYQGQRAQTPDHRVFILTRSAYAGQQRNAAVTWSGDTTGDWATLARQVPEGLNFSISGIPYWNSDIGGFFGSRPADPAYRELFARWFQFGAFCPMFRVHGTGAKKEMWEFGPDLEKTLVKYDKLRYRLLPYTYSVAWHVTHDGGTMMRPLVMDFPGDPDTYHIGDQYLFGPALLVNPVTHPGVTTRPVYLPGHADWTDFDTGKRYPAGGSVDMPAPVERMPLLVRAGSIVPLGPDVQDAQAPCDPIELRVYPGADGAFTLYEDAGDGYGYERGAFATIPLRWTEATRTLSIGARQGGYPGMPADHTFRVVYVTDGVGAGPDVVAKPAAEVHYTGAAVDVAATN